MNLLCLRKKFGGVVFRQEKMVDGGSHFDAQPLGEFLILHGEILDGLLLFDFLEKLREAVTFNDISPEPVDGQLSIHSTREMNKLFHIDI